MSDSAAETQKSSQIPDVYFLTKAGISAEKAKAIIDKQKIAAENIEQAKAAGSDLYERIALGYPVTELKLGSGVLQLALESPTTDNLTEKIKEGLAGLNPTPPEDEERAIYDGIASKALTEKDFTAAVKALVLATGDTNLEKPEVIKRVQDATQGDEEEQLKLAQVLSELLPKKESSPNSQLAANLSDKTTSIDKEATSTNPINLPKPEPTAPNISPTIDTPTKSQTETPTPITTSPVPTETITTTNTTVVTNEVPMPAQSTTNANETVIPEPTKTPDLTGYALPQIKAVTPESLPQPLNLAGTRPQAETKPDLPDPFASASANIISSIEPAASQAPLGLRPVPEQPIDTPVPNIGNPDVKPPISATGAISRLNPFKRAA